MMTTNSVLLLVGLVILDIAQFTSSNPLPIEIPEGLEIKPIATIISTALPCIPLDIQQYSTSLPSFTIHKSVEACNEMTRLLNNVAPSINSSCPWEYTCEYKQNRFPQYLIQANCLKSFCEGCSSDDSTNEPGKCSPVEIPLSVYECTNDVNVVGSLPVIHTKGEWIKERVRVACQCNHNVVESV